LLDKEENEFEEQPVANAAKELMKRLDPHAESDAGSGASTPGFVRTAAEVADSAALLDKEDPEPEVTDEEAGQTGFRRMSLTPIQDVAATAAEVADTAKDLDREVSADRDSQRAKLLTSLSPSLDLSCVLPSMRMQILMALMSLRFRTTKRPCLHTNV
jgi:hypothetical protein